MNIAILSVFPDLYRPFLQTSLIKRAQEKGLISFQLHALFDYVAPKERIDAPSFGPGAGMLLKPEVLEKAIDASERLHGPAFKIFFSPQGKKLNQKSCAAIMQRAQECGHLMLLPARYEGMDARVEETYADEILSIGDFVLMGGDLPAMLFLEAGLRLLPGVVGKTASVENESFSGPFLDYPEYTEPVEWHGKKVPDIVRSGNHEAIRRWRMEQAAQRSVHTHFSWVRSSQCNDEEKQLIAKFLPHHYAVLLHGDVLVGPQERKVGTTSVTSVDIHDIARSSATYGLKGYFIVTPLADQQKIVETLMDFWQKGEGIDYNPVRHEALKRVKVVSTLDDVIKAIEIQEGEKPLLIATSARSVEHEGNITFFDQERVWQHYRPVVFLFGTGQGINPDVIRRCDFLLPPVKGFSDFNHLSVRTAVGIILDRWLGINVIKGE